MKIKKDKILEAANKYIKKGQWDNAIVEFRKILNEEPNDCSILNQIGDLYLKKGDVNKAVEEFSKAAEIYRKDGFNMKAIAMYRKILRNVPENFEVHSKLAQLFAEQGLIREAIDQYKAVADTYSEKGSIGEALDTYQQIVDLDPGNPNTRLKLAELYEKEGFSEKAIREYQRVAEHYFKAGEHEEAINIYKKAADVDPSNIRAKLVLVQAYEELSMYQEAMKLLQFAIEVYPDNTELLYALGNLYTKMQDYKEAQKTYEKALRINPNDLNVREALGIVLAFMGNVEKGSQIIDTVVKQRYKRHEYGFALKALKDFSKAAPNHLETHQKLAIVYQKLGQEKGEIEEYEFIADYYYKHGKLEEAFNIYETLARKNPDNSQYKVILDEIAIKIGKTPSYEEEIPIHDEEIDLEEMEISEEKPGASKTSQSDEEELDEMLGLDELTGVEDVLTSGKSDSFEDSLKAISKASTTSRPGDEEWFQEVSADEILEEVDVYIRYGLKKKAIELLKRSIKAKPDELKLKKKYKELVMAKEATVASKPKAPPVKPVPKKKPEAKPAAVGSVKDELEELYKEIKGGVDLQLKKADYEAHYNMGIGYKEMGMIDEAISEFTISSESSELYVPSYSMKGLCHMAKGAYKEAIDSFQKALRHPSITKEVGIGILYDMGRAYEGLKKYEEALKIYHKVQKDKGAFRDTIPRIKRLQQRLGIQ